jgi:RNA polymerase sigma-70 factor (ECF subfamily)
MSDINDIAIVDRVLGGDVEAFSELMAKYQDRVFRYVYSKFNNHDEVLDITQDIFIMTFESLDKFRRESKFSTWLFSIMVNYCKNYRKKAGRFRSVSIDKNEGDGFEFQLADERENTEEQIINRDSLRILKDELFKLSDDYREILVLRDIEGMSYNEISKVLGISLSNVKVRIHRGRELLKDRLQEIGLL